MPTPVFTILNHGTRSHRTRDDGEIISVFGDYMWDTWDGKRGENEYTDYLITDGPGADSRNDPNNPMPGQFNPKTLDKQRRDTRIYKHPKAWAKSTSTGRGMTTGKGWEINVDHVMYVLEQKKSGKLGGWPTTINMIGWSRGAVTCFRIANAVWDKWGPGQCPNMNIFAIDPVAGLGNKGDLENSRIPPCVKKLVITLAEHERRGGFEPQDLSRIRIVRPDQTRYVFLPFPGKHNTQVRTYVSQDDLEAGAWMVKRHDFFLTLPAQIVWSLAFVFLATNGTRFVMKERPYKHRDKWKRKEWLSAEMNPLSAAKHLSLYDALRYYRPLYHRYLRSRGVSSKVQGGLHDREFTEGHNLSRYVPHPYFFINLHHYWCFRRVHGNRFDRAFGGGRPFDTRPLDPARMRASGSQWDTVPCPPIAQTEAPIPTLFPALIPRTARKVGTWVTGQVVSSVAGVPWTDRTDAITKGKVAR